MSKAALPAALWVLLLVAPAVGRASGDSTGTGGAEVVSASFEMVSDDSDGPGRGRLCFGPRGIWRLDYETPVHQVFVSTESLSTILYPEESRAIRIHSGLMEPPGLVFFLVHAMATHEEMVAAGMRISDFSLRGDTSVTVWRPAEESGSAASIRVFRVSRMTSRLEVLAGHEVRRTFWVERSVRVRGATMPAVVHEETILRGERHHATVRYSDIRSERVDPLRMFDQALPETWLVEDRNW